MIFYLTENGGKTNAIRCILETTGHGSQLRFHYTLYLTAHGSRLRFHYTLYLTGNGGQTNAMCCILDTTGHESQLRSHYTFLSRQIAVKLMRCYSTLYLTKYWNCSTGIVFHSLIKGTCGVKLVRLYCTLHIFNGTCGFKLYLLYCIIHILNRTWGSN